MGLTIILGEDDRTRRNKKSREAKYLISMKAFQYLIVALVDTIALVSTTTPAVPINFTLTGRAVTAVISFSVGLLSFRPAFVTTGS